MPITRLETYNEFLARCWLGQEALSVRQLAATPKRRGTRKHRRLSSIWNVRPGLRSVSYIQPATIGLVVISGFEWDDDNIFHVERHEFTQEEVEEVFAGDHKIRRTRQK